MRRPSLILSLAVAPIIAACAVDQPVTPLEPQPPSTNVNSVAPMTRTYYIAADEVNWNFAPSGINQITGKPFEGDELVFTEHGDTRIGTIYRKALYHGYTDANFTTLKPIDPAWAHLGSMGPLIRAVVGDTVKVVFKNNLRIPVSMHPHGFFYLKDSEGNSYDDGTSGEDKQDDKIMPGRTYTYIWVALPRSGPGPADGSTVMWMYHSHVDEVRDVYAGLMGPIIITARNAARPDGSSNEFDREFITNFEVVDENASHYIDYNIEHFTDKPQKVDPEDEDFIESNLKHAINGYIYGNLPLNTMSMRKGDRVRWYLMAMGTEVDLHTPHWHGVTVLEMGSRKDVVELLPASMLMVDLEPDNVGTWLFHCHVADHITAGMTARFRINP
ncbi:MAG: multicopper oxidase domain-containing protein [Gemmatimonadaceae bacterium]